MNRDESIHDGVPMFEADDRILTLTAQIAMAYLSANVLARTAVPGLIRDIHRSLSGLKEPPLVSPPRDPRQETRPTGRAAVDIQKSVFANHLICLEDGKSVTMLKRHLRTAHGLTPEAYRARWSLPANYPMVAPDYAKVRSKLAKALGLGRKRR